MYNFSTYYFLSILISICCGFTLSSCHNQLSNEQKRQNLIATDSVTLISTGNAHRVNNCQISIVNPSAVPTKFYITPAGYNFQNYQTLLHDIIKPGSTDKEKVTAIWRFTESWTYHSISATNERSPHDPLRLFNSFESGLCDDRNAALTNMFLLAGLKAHVYHLQGHIVSEVYYEGGWHMYDADWNLHFNDDKQQVASVEYLSNHPEAICRENSNGGSDPIKFSIGMQILKHVYSTKTNNHIEPWFIQAPLDYTNSIQLNQGDKLLYSISKGWCGSYLANLIGQHAITNVNRIGVLSRRVANCNTTRINADEWVMTETLPYAMKDVSITYSNTERIKGDIKVYYSPDGMNWYYKGLVTPGLSSIKFNVFDSDTQPLAFNYFIKLSGRHVQNAIDSRLIEVKSRFLFSDKLFLNADNAFKLVYLQMQSVGSLKVNYTAENE